MKIKRYFAPDIRQAIRMVRDEQGPDAVILSNRKVDGGVEIVAARDFDEQVLHDRRKPEGDDHGLTPRTWPEVQAPKAAPASRAAARTNPAADGSAGEAKRRAEGAFQEALGQRGDEERPEPSLKPALEAARRAGLVPAKTRPAAEAPKSPAEPRAAVEPPPEPQQPKAPPPQSSSQPPEEPVLADRREAAPVAAKATADSRTLGDLYQEMRQVRRLLDHHLGETNWQSAVQRAPTRLDLLRRLSEAGFSKRLSLGLSERAGDADDFETAWGYTRDLLSLRMPLAEDNLLDYGGIVALVGPTGVGKTTTIAKLAARFRLRHGPRQVALITLDNYRIGAHEQLGTYGRILDVPVRTASSVDELRHLLAGFDDRRLVLIDTAGMGQRDARVAEQAELLARSNLPIHCYLVLSAAAQYRSLRETIERFGVHAPRACVLTKLDEAVQLGPTLSAVIEHELPMAFLCDGQQVPEDLHVAVAHLLLDRCFVEPGAGEDEEAGPYTYRDWVAHASS